MLRNLLICILAATTINAAHAQPSASDTNWPERPLRFIVPLPAGAAVDPGRIRWIFCRAWAMIAGNQK